MWGSWCPPCRKEAPILKKVSEDLGGKDVVFVGIDTRDSDAAAKAFLDNIGLTYANVVDPDGELLLAFKGDLNPNAIPSTLVLDKQGRVAARIVGGVEEGTLRAVDRTARRRAGLSSTPCSRTRRTRSSTGRCCSPPRSPCWPG